MPIRRCSNCPSDAATAVNSEKALRFAAEDAFRVLRFDGEPLVRRVLSDCLKRAAGLPRDIALALAYDKIEVAEPMLEHSPALTDDDLIRIIDLLVEQVNLNLVAKQIRIKLQPEAAKYILDKTCSDRSYGARPLRRALQKYIEDPLSEALIQGTFSQRPALGAERRANRTHSAKWIQRSSPPLPTGEKRKPLTRSLTPRISTVL